MVNQIEGGKISHVELAGFRFMLLAWAAAVLIGLYAGYCYYRQGTAMDGYLELVNGPFKCQQDYRSKIPNCNEDGPWSEILCNMNLNEKCPALSKNDPQLKGLSEEYALWVSRFEFYRAMALILFLLAPSVFYGVRWGMTGRLKPLWLLPKR